MSFCQVIRSALALEIYKMKKLYHCISQLQVLSYLAESQQIYKNTLILLWLILPKKLQSRFEMKDEVFENKVKFPN